VEVGEQLRLQVLVALERLQDEWAVDRDPDHLGAGRVVAVRRAAQVVELLRADPAEGERVEDEHRVAPAQR
jgi:hypothetical protein